MKEIPIPFIKAQQAGIVLFVIIAVVLQEPMYIFALAIIHAVGLVLGPSGNLFIAIAKPFLKNRIAKSETQSSELARFNASLGALFLTCAIVGFALNYAIIGFVFASLCALAAFVAICGYCIGCTIYYQIKHLIR